MKPVIIIAIVLLITISAYIFYSSTLVIEEEGWSNYQPRAEDINAAIQLTSMNGPTNFGGFPNQIGQQGIPMSQMQMYSSNPLIQQKMMAWSMPATASSSQANQPNFNKALATGDVNSQIAVTADVINNAFDANGKLKTEVIMPLQTGANSFVASLKSNFTKQNLDSYLTQIISLATAVKQKLNVSASPAVCKFDAAKYSAFYSDLQKAFGGDTTKLQQHYLTFGIKEGRTPCGSINPKCKFDAAKYESYYPDLKKAFNGDAAKLKQHYVTFGIKEGRRIC
jgi:hypothetical protein